MSVAGATPEASCAQSGLAVKAAAKRAVYPNRVFQVVNGCVPDPSEILCTGATIPEGLWQRK